MSDTKPPKHLGPSGKRFWNECVERYVFASPDQWRLLELIGVQLDRLEGYRVAVEEDGVVITTKGGDLREHPSLSSERAASNTVRLLCRELGLTTADTEDTRLARGKGY